MSDNLNIQIDTTRAQAALDSLGTAADRMIAKLGQLNGTTNLDKVVQSLTAIDAASAKVTGAGFAQLQAAIDKLDASKLSAAALRLNNLGTINLGTASAVSQLQTAINNVNAERPQQRDKRRMNGVGSAARFDATLYSFGTAVRNAVGGGRLTANAATMAGAFFNAGGSISQLNGHLAGMLGVSKRECAMLGCAGCCVQAVSATGWRILHRQWSHQLVQIDRFKSSLAIAGAGAGAKAFAELQNITKQVGGNVGAMLSTRSRSSSLPQVRRRRNGDDRECVPWLPDWLDRDWRVSPAD